MFEYKNISKFVQSVITFAFVANIDKCKAVFLLGLYLFLIVESLMWSLHRMVLVNDRLCICPVALKRMSVLWVMNNSNLSVKNIYAHDSPSWQS